MRPLVLAILVLSLALPHATGIMASAGPSPLRVELGSTASTVLTVQNVSSPSFDLTVTGTFGSAFADRGAVRILLGPTDEANSATIGPYPNGSLSIPLLIDATGWKPRGRTSTVREIDLTVNDGIGTPATASVEVSAYHSWETHVDGVKFGLALLPLVAIFVGIAFLKRDGLEMSFLGWLIAALLAIGYFHTSGEVVLGSTAVGIIKAFGISIAVLLTMLMIFIMKEVGALEVISDVMKRVVHSKEEQALFIGIGFGTFLTSLGVTTPAMFPPLLMAMGFNPFAAVMISVLGYNASTSFALLSIPVTLPAEVGGISAEELAWKISLFLPVLSVAISFAMLYFIGGMRSVRKGLVPAILAGLAIAVACLAATWSALHPLEVGSLSLYIPLRVAGIFAGLVAMVVLYLYHRFKYGRPRRSGKGIGRRAALVAFFPWILLTALAAVTSVAQVQTALEEMLGTAEVVTVFADQEIDLNVLSQIYTWILVATLASIPVLRPTRKQLNSAVTVWLQRGWKPFAAFSMYFAIAYIMFFSGKEIIGGALVNSPDYVEFNMNLILGTSLAVAFGGSFMYVAGSLGVFGSFVGGSETASNVMFLGVQRSATAQTDTDFMTAYAAHAAGGGIASAITPAKITNAVVLIGEDRSLEARVMRANTLFVVFCTVAIGLMTALFITLNL
ncbi:MAG: L-lactate permease [Thermoplasmata archaeon]|nr:L-lactate permease [Thermoplasmata archaeon]